METAAQRFDEYLELHHFSVAAVMAAGAVAWPEFLLQFLTISFDTPVVVYHGHPFIDRCLFRQSVESPYFVGSGSSAGAITRAVAGTAFTIRRDLTSIESVERA